MSPVTLTIAVALTAWAVGGRATAVPSVASPRCPLVVPNTAVKVEASNGWVGFAPYPMQLQSAAIAGGPPASFAELQGEVVSRRRGAAATRYDFGGLATEEGIWLICTYGDAGEIELGSKLPAHLKRCTITHRHRPRGEPRRIDVECG